jgi:glyoxylase-like metal-dependent hydrolase (beta-lactamase superfamily II)
VEVLQISPGLWRWTGWHEEWKQDVGSVYVETPDGVVLIDPIVPPEDTDRFWDALDRDVKRVGGEVHVLVSVFWHTRDARQMVERYRARVWAPRRGRPAIERRAGVVTDAFAPGDPLPGSLQALRTARAAEVVYWIPEHGALVPGDVLLTDEQGGIRLCPASWLPESVDQRKLAESLRPLLDLQVERVLLSHGEPVLTGAKPALTAALDVK